MHALIAKYVLAPLLHYSRGTRVNSCARELEESQWWPRDKILELQDQRLRQLVRYAYDKVPYYRRIFDERDLKPEDIEPAPRIGTQLDTDFLTGMGKKNEDFILILDIDRVFSSEEIDEVRDTTERASRSQGAEVIMTEEMTDTPGLGL